MPFDNTTPCDISGLTVVAKEFNGVSDQPAAPKFKTALLQIYVRSAPYGGSDKSSNGCRYDYIPFVNGMISAGMSCQVIHYLHEEHDKFMEICKQFDALIVRCNPGQIKADGGDQGKFDDAMRALKKSGKEVWPSPDVMEFMGAKDALTKIADLSIGLPDTLSYYDEASFVAGFKKTMAFQPRVIKQNRGSSGEGIWIIKLKEGNYCPGYGDRICEDGELLSLMEANDNHAEEHTVGEFIEFCVNGAPLPARPPFRLAPRPFSRKRPPAAAMCSPTPRQAAPTSRARGPPRASASTWRVARRRAACWSTSASARASSRARCAS